MSVFTDKRVFGIKKNNSSGIATAGQVCANDIILWVIFLLPVNIIIHGAGQCFVAIGLFAGNVIGWVFLARRMNSYTEISDEKIHNAPELFAARYGSRGLKNLVSVVWIVTLGVMLTAVLKVIVAIAAYYTGINDKICLSLVALFLVLATILVDNRFMGIVKTIVFIMVIAVCLFMIALIFYRMDVYELLDNYRRARLAGGTSAYLNILYYDGEYISTGMLVSMAGVGLGCIAMPLMYKGVITIRDVKALDAGRIWAVVFEGFTIISSCALALLVVPVLYPQTVSSDMNSFQVYNLLIKTLLGTSLYAYAVRFAVLMIFMVAFIVMLESFMRNICEHIRGLIPSIKVKQPVKLAMDIGVVAVSGILLLVFSANTDFDMELMIRGSWGLCAAALAAPLMLTLMYRGATKAGMYAGIVSGILTFVVWQYTPFLSGTQLAGLFGGSGDVAGFLVSLVMCFAVSFFTKKNSEKELEVFDRMKREQV